MDDHGDDFLDSLEDDEEFNFPSTDSLKWLFSNPAASMRPTTKHMTVGGYMLTLDYGSLPTGVHASVRSMVHSKSSKIYLEIRIEGADPTSIRVQRRFSMLIVIGLKKSDGDKENIQEVVSVYVPQDVNIADVHVTRPDDKSRVFIQGP